LIAAALVFGAVMAVVVWRPRGLSPAFPALAGAIACVALRLASPHDVVQVLARTWNATLALVGLMLLSAVLDGNGAFRAAAHFVARRGTDGRRLFIGLAGLTAVTTAILANDGAILILTPIVAELALLLGFTPEATLAYLFTTGFLCDALSTVLPTANLTNILLVDTLGVHPGAYVGALLLPSAVTLIFATLTLRWQFARALPACIEASRLGPPPPFSPRSARATGTALGLLLLGYGAAGLVGLPLGVVVAVVASGLAAVEHRAGAVDAVACLRRLPWSIVVFASALFVVVTALSHTPAGAALTATLDPAGHALPWAVVRAGLVVTALTAIGNNLPTLLTALLSLHALRAPSLVAFGALVGADVGSKLTPIGSLATLMWLDMLHRRRIRIGWGRYVALALAPTAVATAATLAVLAVEAAVW
jgi:arsenical pump membrane protein